MYKRLVILGLVLLLAGAAVLSWSQAEKIKEHKQAAFYKAKYASELDDYFNRYEEWLQLPAEERSRLPWGLDEYEKAKTEVQSREKQQGRLKADLDKLASGEREVYPFADFFYGENWREELRRYKERKEQREIIFTCSVVCASAGGAIFGGCLLLWTARLIIRVLSHLKKLPVSFFRNRKGTGDKQPAKTDVKEVEKSSEQREKPNESRKTSASLGGKQKIKLKKHSKVLINSGWCNFEEGPSESFFRNLAKSAESAPKADRATSETQEIAVQLNGLAQNVQQSTLEYSEPLGDSLKELTQQMSAIREYACQQQDRVEKLQDGYDWGIIRTFCLRVIRCIDNLEERINRLSEQGVETAGLKEIRDELLFALESSGVEQFEPEIDSDYRGQERYAEAVKEKEYSDDPDTTGKIAKVVRPGYQYVIDQENTRVIRTAQVKLYN